MLPPVREATGNDDTSTDPGLGRPHRDERRARVEERRRGCLPAVVGRLRGSVALDDHRRGGTPGVGHAHRRVVGATRADRRRRQERRDTTPPK